MNNSMTGVLTTAITVQLCLHAPPFMSTAYAQDVPPADPMPEQKSGDSAGQDDPPRPSPLSITVRGGSSLGAYESGYMYYLTEFIKRNPGLYDLRIVTGASAGTINALLTIIAMSARCEAPSGSLTSDPCHTSADAPSLPTESLFYQVWTSKEMSVKKLLDVKNAPSSTVSSRTSLDEVSKIVQRRWEQGILPRDGKQLDMVMGSAVTRVTSHDIEVQERFSIPRQEEKFVIRVKSAQPPFSAPRVTNYRYLDPQLQQPLLPFLGTDDEAGTGDQTIAVNDAANFNLLRKVLFASAAFPIVFPPQDIACESAPTGQRLSECEPASYIDGGVFDNSPLRLAYRIAEAGLRRDEHGELFWIDDPLTRTMPSGGKAPDDLVFWYVDPDHTSYPMDEEKSENGLVTTGNFFNYLGILLGSVIDSARAKELYTLIEEHPEVRDRMALTTRDFPNASGVLGNFFGFFDAKFRQYDFFLGMHDARRFLQRYLAAQDKRIEHYPEQLPPALTPEQQANWIASWRPFHCLRAWFDEWPVDRKGQTDGFIEHQGICRDDPQNEHRDFKILLQASLDRLYAHCGQLKPDCQVTHIHCQLAGDGAAPPLVEGVLVPDDVDADRREIWVQQGDENEFEHFLRLLSVYEFEFADLGLERDEATQAAKKMHSEFLYYVENFADKLPLSQEFLIKTFGKPMLYYVVPTPPETIVYLTVGRGSELGWSTSWALPNWARLNNALEIQGGSELYSGDFDEVLFTFTPMVGFEFRLPVLPEPWIHLRLGHRIGYQFSTDGGLLPDEERRYSDRKHCDQLAFERNFKRCSAPVTQVFVALSFLERVRLQLGAEWIVPIDGALPWRHDHWKTPNVTLGVGWQWISPFFD